MSTQTQTVAPVPQKAEPPATTTASLAARLGAEAFGTFALVLAIVGVALYNQFSNGSYVFPVALAAALGVGAAIAAVGHVSGGHFNPAVSLGMAIVGRLSWRDLVPYWAAQVIGGWIAAAAMYFTIPSSLVTALKQSSKHALFGSTANGYGTHSPLYTISSGAAQFDFTSALIVEVAATAVFVGIVIGVTDKRSKITYAPLAIGFALATAILVAGPVTNASINPARSTASAIFSPGGLHNIFTGTGIAGQLWVFWVAPLIGALIAGLCYLAFAAPRGDRPVAVEHAEESVEGAVEAAEVKTERAFSELKDKVADDEVPDLAAAANPVEPEATPNAAPADDVDAAKPASDDDAKPESGDDAK